MVAQACCAQIQKAKAEASWILGQSEAYNDTISQETKVEVCLLGVCKALDSIPSAFKWINRQTNKW